MICLLVSCQLEKKSSNWYSLKTMPIHSPKFCEHQRPFFFFIPCMTVVCFLQKVIPYKEVMKRNHLYVFMGILKTLQTQELWQLCWDLIPNKAFHNQILLVCLKKVEWCLTGRTRTKFGYFIKAICSFV